ncbi:TonB-dependent receptor domain-containing protein [Soonwooa sp.]|uniref:TonB-dependent receptor plug domain-containing protein n=1 Tax=Soonwooa sp. TaxID=1938592 RepID=UPI0028B211F2|nr:TonB-dependent receptor [Soonwooa sp.]
MKRFFLNFSFIFPVFGFAQEAVIDTVFVDSQFENAKNFSKIKVIKSDDVLKNATSLSDLLSFQTPIYIKENGRGMVSSPSFRGTTAQQTAFVWNGININSQFLGQGDINNISLLGYDNIAVKSGGGSVLYGSGAIGGSIHLNNSFGYNKGFKGQVFSEYASFETSNPLLKTSFSNDKFSFQFAVNHNRSKNNYEVEERNYVNRNGAYDNTGVNLGFAYKVDDKNEIYSQSQIFDAIQNYPLLSEFSTPSKYLSQSFKSIVGWYFKNENFKNDFKVAHLKDDYQYYMNSNFAASESGGGTKQFILKDDFKYQINANSELNFLGEVSQIEALGVKTGIGSVKRRQGSSALLYRDFSIKNFNWEVGAKKEFVEGVKSPFLFSVAGNYSVADFYAIKFSASKNFRAPSFNDLYWKPGGNEDLKPETSYQFEVSNNFKWKSLTATVTPYYMDIINMLRWVPGKNGMYHATNTGEVKSYGVETQLGLEKKYQNFSYRTMLSYAFTKSEDQANKKQLPYVPYHKVSLEANFNYKIFGLHLQSIWNSKIFSDGDESVQYIMDPFYVINLGADVQVLKSLKLGVKVNNLTSEVYRTVYAYYMPKRNFAVNMNFNF